MIDRRSVLLASLGAAAFLSSRPTLAAEVNLVLVHGRSQEGLDPAKLKSDWTDALVTQLKNQNLALPQKLNIEFPYYGDRLAEFVAESQLPRLSDIRTRGGEVANDFLAFQSQLANELAENAGITDAEIDAEYGNNTKERGPLNWEWVQAILQAIDKHAGGMSRAAIEEFTRDVYLYLTSSHVRETIDGIVMKSMSSAPTVVVGHSLGSIVAYNILRNKVYDVPLLITVGSPLGIRAVRTPLAPIAFPKGVSAWFNAYDVRDVVALNPLDTANFAVTPPIENYSGVRNSTSNRHGISGYLGDKTVARRICRALTA